MSCGLVHQVPDGVVDEQEAVKFLLGPVGVLRTQYQVRPAEVGLDFVQGGLELPSLGVEGGQFRGRGLVRVEDRGDEPVDALMAGDGLFHHTCRHPTTGVVDVAAVEDLGRGGRPNASMFAFVSGMSNVVPPIEVRRQSR